MQEFQLPCYLLAVERGLTEAPRERQGLRAGFIGLKSTREKHLKHEEFARAPGSGPGWPRPWWSGCKTWGAAWPRGISGPNPTPAPEGKDLGACKYCPYDLLCGFHRRRRPGR